MGGEQVGSYCRRRNLDHYPELEVDGMGDPLIGELRHGAVHLLPDGLDLSQRSDHREHQFEVGVDRRAQ